MRALVTGGAGFIASHIVDALIGKGHDVTIVDNFSAGSEDNVNPNAQLHRLDITDSEALDAVFASAKPEVVYHLAAQTSVRHSMTDTSFDATVNVIGSINALQSCVNHDVSRILFSSPALSTPSQSPFLWTRPILFVRSRRMGWRNIPSKTTSGSTQMSTAFDTRSFDTATSTAPGKAHTVRLA